MRLIKFLSIVLVTGLLALVGLSGASPARAARTRVVFWHEMTGPAQTELLSLVKQFNRSQSSYEVVPEYEGSYNEAVQKILRTHGTRTAPALFQSMDISTALLNRSGYTTKMQHFVDRDHYDLSRLSPGARAFYSQNGQLLAMPFNTSQPVLYYNQTLFKKYGVTPPPLDPSYSDVTRAATQLYQRSHHRVKGLSVESYGWFFEQFLANSGEPLANHDNGRTGTPTRVNFTGPGAQKAMKWLQENVRSGNFADFGSGNNAGANELAAFLAGKVGIFLQSSADITQITAGTKDRLGVCYYPHPNDQRANGVAIGGAALWIGNDQPEQVQRGAFEFTKFLLRADKQAEWQIATGYLAVNQDARRQPALKRLYKKSPAAKIASDQLARTRPNAANSGVLMEGLIQERVLTQTAMQQIVNGRPVKQALEEAQRAMNQYIKTNNQANQAH